MKNINNEISYYVDAMKKQCISDLKHEQISMSKDPALFINEYMGEIDKVTQPLKGMIATCLFVRSWPKGQSLDIRMMIKMGTTDKGKEEYMRMFHQLRSLGRAWRQL